MSAGSSENSSLGTGRDRLLLFLKSHGAQSASFVAKGLDITGEAARQHLQKLLAAGLVTFDQMSSGVGRPRRIWKLTERGQAKFPNSHSLVTVQLIHAIREQLGEAVLERLVRSREKDIENAYRRVMKTARTLRTRVQRLAEIRNAEGYMAEWREESSGVFLLIENHCPICAAATACQGFCRAELSVFRKCLGGSAVHVERVDHMISGARRCAYRITRK